MEHVIFRGRLALFTMVAAAISMPLICAAQPSASIARLGYLTPIAQPAREEVFRQELRRLGYVEGKNIAIEYRSANGRFELLPDLATELAGLKVDVIVAVVTQAAVAAKKSTGIIPIVMIGVSDPVQSGLVASLGRPGANITGTSALTAQLVGKQLELLREALPKTSRVAALWNPANSVFQKQQADEAKASAMGLGIRLSFFEARTGDELDRTFAEIAKQKMNALIVLGDPVLYAHASRIANLAARYRIPAVAGTREFANVGGLLTYGPAFSDNYRRAATYVDKILKGTKPADLPVEQPTTFELVINARTAKALGITIPDSLVMRADQVMK
jgi:putative ABC transport system substrate-binding protein